MCGIVGYIGKEAPLQVIMDGLSRLEYRGYDSAGVAYLNGKGIEVFRSSGKLKVLQGMLRDPRTPVLVGLGHTRWATHGAPTIRNAHPHCAAGVAVVHNGIIENYRELRVRLEGAGRAFSSDTDTEVVPHLIAEALERGNSLHEAIREAVVRLDGSYALGIMSECAPDVLFAVRKGSPLVIGIGDGAYYFASDVPALLPYTRRYIFLEDGQLCTLTSEGIDICAVDSNISIPVHDQIVEVDWTPAAAEKGGYAHFMLKEIYEQPRAVRNTVGEWLKDPGAMLDAVAPDRDLATSVGRLQIVACGTSYHAGLVGKYLVEHLARVPVEVDIASEYRYREPILAPGALFVSITQSGETADTLAAQRAARERGAMTLTICNVVGSTASRETDAVLYTHAGPEIGVASTKSFTSQIAALFAIALSLGVRRGRLSQEECEALVSDLSELPARLETVLKQNLAIRELGKTLLDSRDFLYLGRGINFPIALEGALKLKEISYLHAEGYPAGEMKHGPIALIDKGVPAVVLIPRNALFEKTLSNIEEIKARGGRIIAVTDSPGLLAGKVDDVIEVPVVHPLLAPFVATVPLQLLAYHIGVLRGCDVDKPRNLAKSVTVE